MNTYIYMYVHIQYQTGNLADSVDAANNKVVLTRLHSHGLWVVGTYSEGV